MNELLSFIILLLMCMMAGVVMGMFESFGWPGGGWIVGCIIVAAWFLGRATEPE